MHLTAVSEFVAFHIPEAGLLNKSSCSVTALGAKSDLDVQQARMGRENAWQNRTCKCICVFCDHCLNFCTLLLFLIKKKISKVAESVSGLEASAVLWHWDGIQESSYELLMIFK
jgi:hypothetical protein